MRALFNFLVLGDVSGVSDANSKEKATSTNTSKHAQILLKRTVNEHVTMNSISLNRKFQPSLISRLVHDSWISTTRNKWNNQCSSSQLAFCETSQETLPNGSFVCFLKIAKFLRHLRVKPKAHWGQVCFIMDGGPVNLVSMHKYIHSDIIADWDRNHALA